MTLPIDALRGRFDAISGPCVITAPTGSGKSTQVPRWCADRGPTLVVEPRRVACRALAERVAHLEGCRLGERVGYRVRDESRAGDQTVIEFVTPGVALRMAADPNEERGIQRYAAVVLDEFHERSLDLDLLLALGRARFRDRLVVMSATLEAERLAEFVEGPHLAGEGRTFPVDVRYRGEALLPSDDRLPQRVAKAVEAAQADPGDILVFLPGKAEIAAVAGALRGRFRDVVELHGGLSLKDQRAAFEPASGRKIVVATNVAETSLTIPGIGVVIDSGLVRRTRYHGGRGYLTLLPIAMDSADQRAGRAGRTAAGVCYRLWSEAGNLAPVTPPEIHRESLVPLVLGAAACGAEMEDLRFADPPKDHAVASAQAELEALGAVAGGRLTRAGEALFGLPLDAALGRLLVEAKGTPAAADVVDLVAALAVGRPMFTGRPEPEHDLRDGGCDAVALIRAVREGDPNRHRLHPAVLSEARRIAKRLRRVVPVTEGAVSRKRLALTLLAADRRLAHVARRRKKHTAWSNGGTELSMGRDTALAPLLDTPEGTRIEAALVLDSRALGKDSRRTELIVTAAMPVPLQWLVEAGVGRTRVARAKVKGGRVLAVVERVHAKKVLQTEEVEPQGAAARAAIAGLVLEGRLFRGAAEALQDRLEARALAARLAGESATVPELEPWLVERLETLGLESAGDLALLEAEDLLPEPLPEYEREQLDRDFPRVVEMSDVTYRVRYDLKRKVAVMEKVSGRRKEAPSRRMIPRFNGFKVEAHHGHVVFRIR